MRRFNSIDHKLKQIPHRIDRLTIETIEFYRESHDLRS